MGRGGYCGEGDQVTTRWYRGDETEGWQPFPGYKHIYVDKDGLLYFWDETESEAFGPFQTLVECSLSMGRYASSL